MAQRNVDAVVVTHTAKFLGTEPWPFLTGMAAYVEHFLGPHPQLRPLVADIVREVDRRKRAALYSRLESALLDATWVIPIAAFEPSAPIKIHLVGKRVQGYVSTATGHVPPEEDLPLLHTTMSR